ncbi:hypothetical protein KHA80_21275 [Anaerobacillus sp. HL2]|nr:hypothetical protein KHA80_21275 [Anaerobacillus sp. HL2]
MGPLLIVIGLYLAGLFTMRWTLSLWKNQSKKKRKIRIIFIRFSFSLGFVIRCLFYSFIVLMPMALAVPMVQFQYFCNWNTIPIIIAVFLIWYFSPKREHL